MWVAKSLVRLALKHIYDDEEEAVEGLADDKLRDEYRASAEIDG